MLNATVPRNNPSPIRSLYSHPWPGSRTQADVDDIANIALPAMNQEIDLSLRLGATFLPTSAVFYVWN